MLSRRGFRFELRARPGELRQARRIAGACRWVWNRALAIQKQAMDQGAKRPRYLDLASQLTAWRNSPETSWLKQAPIHPLQQTLRDLDRAWSNCFEKRARAPRFKRRGDKDAFRFPDPEQFKIDEANARVFLPKMHWLRYRRSRDIEGEPKNITVALEGTGEQLPGLRDLDRRARRLARHQRRVARRVRGSRNQRKARDHVARVHRKISRARQDHHHKLSTELVRRCSVIAIEDLHVKSMSASASGTIQAPGTNVRAKTGLNRSILQQGWGSFVTMLGWKMQAAAGRLITVPAAYTSQMCSACGHCAAENRTTQAGFACVACGHAQNADHNAARNILARALSTAAGTAALPGGTGEVTPVRYERVQLDHSGQEPTKARSGVCLPNPL